MTATVAETVAETAAVTGDRTEMAEGGGSAGPARPPRRPLSFEARALAQALAMLACGTLGFLLFLLVVSPIQQDRSQEVGYDQLREELAAATAPTGGVIEPGHPVALLRIPGIELTQVVVEGTASGDLAAGPGHRRDTALPGQAGVSLVYGKASTFGGPFARVTDLQPGDQITATTGQGEFEYRVEGVRRDGDPVPSPLAKGKGRLTLVTADGAGPLRRGATVFVDAALLDTPAPTPAGRPKIIPPQEKAMASDSASYFGLVIWLQALGIAIAAFVWARHSWGPWETHIVGTPIVLTAVWNVYENLAQAMPNLL